MNPNVQDTVRNDEPSATSLRLRPSVKAVPAASSDCQGLRRGRRRSTPRDMPSSMSRPSRADAATNTVGSDRFMPGKASTDATGCDGQPGGAGVLDPHLRRAGSGPCRPRRPAPARPWAAPRAARGRRPASVSAKLSSQNTACSKVSGSIATTVTPRRRAPTLDPRLPERLHVGGAVDQLRRERLVGGEPQGQVAPDEGPRLGLQRGVERLVHGGGVGQHAGRDGRRRDEADAPPPGTGPPGGRRGRGAWATSGSPRAADAGRGRARG